MKSRKHPKAIISTFIFFASLCLGSPAESLDTPRNLIERAKKGRTEFIEVLGDIQRLAPLIESKDIFFPYIDILDELNQIASENGVHDLGENLVVSLGFTLTRNGAKWLRLDKDDDAFINLFFRWSENSTRYQVAGLHVKVLILIEDKTELIEWFKRISKSVDTIKSLKSEAYVIESFEQLQANSLQRILLIREGLEPEVIPNLLGDLKTVVGIQTVLSFLNEEMLKAEQVDELEVYLGWVGILGTNLKKINEVIPFYVLAAPGNLISTIIIKFLTLNRPFNLELIPTILGVLLPSQIPSLGSTIMMLYKDKIIPEGLLELLCELTSQLYEKYLSLNLGNEAHEMRKFLSQVNLLRAGLDNKVEGSYRVKLRDKEGLINLVHIGNGKFFMGISVRYGGEVSVDFSFFQITFNAQTQIWEALHYDPNDPVTSNPVNEVFFTKFKLTPSQEGNEIEGTLFTAKLTSPYQGKQIAQLQDFKEARSDSIKEVSGVFEGSERGYTFRLLIYQVDQRLQGVVLVTGPNKIPVNVDLEYGFYDPRRNVAYLTSGRFESFRWDHIRGQFFDAGKRFEGIYFQSVYGLIHQLNFKKSEDS